MEVRKLNSRRREAIKNKKELFDAFNEKISRTAIVYRDTEYVIEGKFCVIAPLDGNRWDVWICNSKDIHQGLDQRSVRNIAANLFKSPCKSQFAELKGEGWGMVEGTEIILQNLKLLGIRKKREDSPETLKKIVERLNATKEARPKRVANLTKDQHRSLSLAPELGLIAQIDDHDLERSM